MGGFKEIARLLCIDEIMSGWKSKATLTGGLPNITFEPRKPVDMGTMLKALADQGTGIMMGLEVVEQPEAMALKKWYEQTKQYAGRDGNKSAATTLRLMDLTPPGSHTCGDSWFGSVTTAVMARKNGRDFSGIIKGKTAMLPMAQMKEIAKVLRRGEWRTATATVDGVKLLFVVYRFSYAGLDKNKDKGVNYFLTTCGSSAPGSMYQAKYSDENGVVYWTELERPACVSFYFSAATWVDDHDNARQSKLAIEHSWDTACPWFRLHTTVAGIVMVDLWKGCGACGLLPPSVGRKDGRRISIMTFVNKFAVCFLTPADAVQCAPGTYPKLPPKANGQAYKTDQYKKYACHVCGPTYRGKPQKPPRVSTFCKTCNPDGNTDLAICGSKTGRSCFRQHSCEVVAKNLERQRTSSLGQQPMDEDEAVSLLKVCMNVSPSLSYRLSLL
eukprot:SAG22_NODE_1660_length_3870_cov_3.165208_1_plen_442_part_00